jgi:hypothetical protein
MRKVRASVNSDLSEALHPDSRTLYPESGNREGRGFGEKAAGETEAVVVVLQEGCFFSELRVITLITKKYSILKTTTTTDYHILDLPLPPQSPPKSRRSIFSQHPIIYRPTHPKNRTPPVAASSKPMAI